MPLRWVSRRLVRRPLRPTWNPTARSRAEFGLRLIPTPRNEFHTTSRQHAEVTPLRKELKDTSKASRTARVSQTLGNSHIINETVLSDWELTVGIEIHAQLHTGYKLFSKSRTDYGDEPNTHLEPFDIALPGSQPRFQPPVLIPALRAALALNCRIEKISKFDRKHYFYHDQPSGYQITQYYAPFAKDGFIYINSDDGLPRTDGEKLRIGIKQIQLEQDTARTQEQDEETNLIDFNRAGHPLIEIISLPHIHSPEAAAAYMRKIQGLLNAVDSVTTGMEMGGLRADVNVSVRRRNSGPGQHSYSGVTGLGQRTEIKNLSSFKAVEDAVRAERDRQVAILLAGGVILGETRGWSLSDPGQTRRLRGKEGEVDYRYMPDPDIAPLRISEDLIQHLKLTLPPVPDQLLKMLKNGYGLSTSDARSLLSLDEGMRLIYFQEVVEMLIHKSARDSSDTTMFKPLNAENDESSQYPATEEELKTSRVAANWVLHELGALITATSTAWHPGLVPAHSMAEIIRLQMENKMTGPSAKRLLRQVFLGDTTPVQQIAERDGLLFTELNDAAYEMLAERIIQEFPGVVDEIVNKGKHGKTKFLIGQMMKGKERNQIDPKKAEKILKHLLGVGG